MSNSLYNISGLEYLRPEGREKQKC